MDNNDIKAYQNKKIKAEDFKSSAYSLLIVGVLGIVAIFLIEFDILPFQINITNKYMTYGVMGVLFVIFIIMGISSMKSARIYESEASKEEDLTKSIRKWVEENITAENIKAEVYFDDDISEEEKFFKYFECLKSKISSNFKNLNPSYLDALCEEIYSELFE